MLDLKSFRLASSSFIDIHKIMGLFFSEGSNHAIEGWVSEQCDKSVKIGWGWIGPMCYITYSQLIF